MARPSVYTPEIVAEICNRLEQGTPLEEICRDEGMPSSRAVYDWLSAEHRPECVPESVAADIARARDIGFDAIANRLRAVARGQGESTQDIQRDKLIIETDLKLLAKWSKKYGEKPPAGDSPENPLHLKGEVKMTVNFKSARAD